MREKLVKLAARYARRKFNELRQSSEYRYAHSSHAASKALSLAEKFYTPGLLGTFGVEGFSLPNNNSISYLNTGESYCLTVLFDSRNNRFSVGSWGDIAERLES